MKLLELCVAICCIILIFTINLSKSNDPSSTGEPHKNVKSKRSSAVSPTEKENGTTNADLTKQKREVSSKGSCQNTIQSEKALIRELLKTIEDFQNYLKTKKGVSINDEKDDVDVDVDDLIGEGRLFDGRKSGRLSMPSLGRFHNFGDMDSPIPFQRNSRPHLPGLSNFDMSDPKPFGRQMERSNDPWKLVEVPHYLDISPTLNRGNMISPLQSHQSENQPNNFDQETNPFERSFGSSRFKRNYYQKN